jgi:choline dehydrogenase-like flavoprotein
MLNTSAHPLLLLFQGGGTAGLACAAKLSEDSSITVGVLEAGQWRPEDPKVSSKERFPQVFLLLILHFQIDYPVMMGQTIMDPNYDWCLKSVPQKNCNDREIILPRGKVLGGSSALNFL